MSKITLTRLPLGTKECWQTHWQQFKDGKHPVWYCWVCKNGFNTDEEVTIHTRDVHGIYFQKTDSDLKIKDVVLTRERKLAWTYDNWCPKCKAGTDQFHHDNNGLGHCTKCNYTFQVQDVQKRMDDFWGKWI